MVPCGTSGVFGKLAAWRWCNEKAPARALHNQISRRAPARARRRTPMRVAVLRAQGSRFGTPSPTSSGRVGSSSAAAGTPPRSWPARRSRRTRTAQPETPPEPRGGAPAGRTGLRAPPRARGVRWASGVARPPPTSHSGVSSGQRAGLGSKSPPRSPDGQTPRIQPTRPWAARARPWPGWSSTVGKSSGPQFLALSRCAGPKWRWRAPTRARRPGRWLAG